MKAMTNAPDFIDRLVEQAVLPDLPLKAEVERHIGRHVVGVEVARAQAAAVDHVHAGARAVGE